MATGISTTADTATDMGMAMAMDMAVIIADIGFRPVGTSAKEFT
jgi:hypothetical protein